MADEMHTLLPTFKARMKIYHSTEDPELSRILGASQRRISQLTGSDDVTDEITEELILERSRYAYNDQLEFFEQNFLGDIMAASFENHQDEMTSDDGGDSDGTAISG